MARAQTPPTTVQLPTFHFFTVQTTVSVPDQGTMVLGGNRPVSTGSTAYGPSFLPPQRGVGMNAGVGQMVVSATIHDMQALDLQTLDLTADKKSTTTGPTVAAALPAGNLVVAGSVADARRQRVEELAAVDREAAGYFEQGRSAEAAGKPTVAKIYYQMAARRASGELKAQVQARLDAVAGQPKPAPSAARP
jgi:hypothetical protein